VYICAAFDNISTALGVSFSPLISELLIRFIVICDIVKEQFVEKGPPVLYDAIHNCQ